MKRAYPKLCHEKRQKRINNPGTNGLRLALSSHAHFFYVQVEWLELDSSPTKNEKAFHFSSKIRHQNVFHK